MNKKNKILISLLLVLVTGLFLYLRKDRQFNATAIIPSKATPYEKSLLSPSIQEKTLSQQIIRPECETLKNTYSNLDQLHNTKKSELRFSNIHKKIGSDIYRLRNFFKASSEGEVETFLVYHEDPGTGAKIIEKTPSKKGPEYLRIEQAEGEILYREVGLNLAEGKLFLHYINNQLKGAQGELPANADRKMIDCRF